MRKVLLIVAILLAIGCNGAPMAPKIATASLVTLDAAWRADIGAYACKLTPSGRDVANAIRRVVFDPVYCPVIRTTNMLAGNADPEGTYSSLIIGIDVAVWQTWPEAKSCFASQPWHAAAYLMIETLCNPEN